MWPGKCLGMLSLAAKDGHPGGLGVGWAWKPSQGDSAFLWRPLLAMRTSHVPSERDRATELSLGTPCWDWSVSASGVHAEGTLTKQTPRTLGAGSTRVFQAFDSTTTAVSNREVISPAKM